MLTDQCKLTEVVKITLGSIPGTDRRAAAREALLLAISEGVDVHLCHNKETLKIDPREIFKVIEENQE